MCKILFLGDTSSIHLKKWTDYFYNKNHEVILVTFSDVNICQYSRVYHLSKKKVNITGGNYHYFFSIGEISKIIKEVKPDYINAHFSYSMGLIGLLSLMYSGVNAKISVVCHGSDVLDPPYPWLCSLINQYVLNQADKIFAVSSQIAETIQKWNISSNKIWTGQYGISKTFISANNIERDIDIISNRSYVPNSRIDELLKTLNHNFYYSKKIVFILPNINDDKLYYFRETYPYITFVKSVSHDELIDYVRRAKIYISATKSDGTSLSLLEALAYGCYPVCSNIAPNREWIVDHVNGRLFFSFGELNNILINLLSSNIPQVGEINKNLINNKGLYEKQMERIEEFILK